MRVSLVVLGLLQPLSLLLNLAQIGLFARGRQLLAGNLLFAGHLSELKDQSIWDIRTDNTLVLEEMHGCQWLDDLAAVGDHCAEDWRRIGYRAGSLNMAVGPGRVGRQT